MKKKKLIIFIPSIEDGGVEKNLFIISNYLSKKIDKISLITAKKVDKKMIKNIKLINPLINVDKSQGRSIKYFFCLITLFIKVLFDKNCLVFAFQANIYAILIAKIFNAKIIVRANSAPSGWSQNIIKKLYSYLINLADGVMVNSFEFKKDFKKKFNINAKCIYNPFDKSLVTNKKVKKKIFKKKSLKILSIGRLTPQKDHLTLLNAAKYIKPKFKPEILILGKGIKYNNLKNYIFKNNLQNIVKLLGYKSDPYIYLKESDIFVLTSKYEGLPNVLLEAQFLKKYIISSDCPTGPKEILLNGKAGDLFRVGDSKKLSKIINNYYLNKKSNLKKIKYGYKNFSRFDFSKNCKKYYNFIQEYF